MNFYERYKKNLNESSIIYRKDQIDNMKKVLELREKIDSDIVDIIDRWAGTMNNVLYGNRLGFYHAFQRDNTKDDEYILKQINYAFTKDVVNDIQAIGHGVFPFDGGRELGFTIIYKDNILECCVYNRNAYCGPETNMVLMMHNAVGPARDTFFSKSIEKEGKATAAEIQQCLLPLPDENNEVQQIKDYLTANASEQLQLPLDEE